MPVDLLLDLDDALEKHIARKAELTGRAIEEIIRAALSNAVDHSYKPLKGDDFAVMRPMIRFDLRSS